ncbi:MAG: LytTR family DNA-binding domain-containing protein [Pseudomonadota bacterium]
MALSTLETVGTALKASSVLELDDRILSKVVAGSTLFLAIFIVLYQPFQLDESSLPDLVFVSISTAIIVFLYTYGFYRLASGFLRKYPRFRSKRLYVEIATTLAVTIAASMTVYALRIGQGQVPISLSNAVLFLYFALTVTPLLVVVTRTVLVIREMAKMLGRNTPKMSQTGNIMTDEPIIHIAREGNEPPLVFKSGDFICASAEGNYVQIVLDSRLTDPEILIRSTFTAFLQQVNHIAHYRQSHRSHMVNLDKVLNITGDAQDKRLRLRGTTRLIPVSRSRVKSILYDLADLQNQKRLHSLPKNHLA